MVNKFHYIKGGSETYYFALKRMLEKEGHTVVDFSMKDEKNFPSQYSEYFVDHVDYAKAPGLKNKIRMAVGVIYSFEAKRKFEKLIKKEKPDLIHLHIFQHQLSPSILRVIKKNSIPAVYTAHDLKMVCLNYKMMHHGRICEDCRDGNYMHCAKNRCVKESFAKSCVNVAEGYLHRWLKSYNAIDAIITPSAFYKKKFAEFGVDANRMIHIPNFLDKDVPPVNAREDRKKYYLYFGRLSEEKGILTLVRAFERLQHPLYIVGTGPIKEMLGDYILQRDLKNITLLGFKNGQELTDLVANAKAVIIPSEWYENGPYSAIEALQLGRPIIGADIGGIPELIDSNGVLFKSGDTDDLTEKIVEFEMLSDEEYAALEMQSCMLFKKHYTWESHYAMLEKVYRQVLLKREKKD